MAFQTQFTQTIKHSHIIHLHFAMHKILFILVNDHLFQQRPYSIYIRCTLAHLPRQLLFLLPQFGQSFSNLVVFSHGELTLRQRVFQFFVLKKYNIVIHALYFCKINTKSQRRKLIFNVCHVQKRNLRCLFF